MNDMNVTVTETWRRRLWHCSHEKKRAQRQFVGAMGAMGADETPVQAVSRCAA